MRKVSKHPEYLRRSRSASLAPAALPLLHAAAAAGNAAVLERLLVCAAAQRLGGSGRVVARSREDVVNARDARGRTPLMVAAGVRDGSGGDGGGAEGGGAACVRLLLAAGADPWAADYCGGRTALFYAAAADAAESAAALLEATEGQAMPDPAFPNAAGARYVDARTAVGFTALHVAVAANALGALRALLRHAPRLSTPSLFDSYDFVSAPRGTCPVHLAARHNRAEAAKMILLAYVRTRFVGGFEGHDGCVRRQAGRRVGGFGSLFSKQDFWQS